MHDFSQGKVSKNIIAQSLPLMLAQLVQLLYNVVDRIYIGHMPGSGSLALTGVGLAFPLAALVSAFTNLFGTGGAPLFAIARGAKKEEQAEKILGQVFSLLIASSVLIFLFCYCLRRPILYLFGASSASYTYADQYLRIYLFGTPFSMLAAGLNGFVNAQGYPKTGMVTILAGAGMNLILDPILIYGLHMGVAGAALATVISQFVSAAWVLLFFFGKRTLYRIRRENLKIDFGLLKEIIALGLAGFIMMATNCLVQAVCNITLRAYGGDLYVAVMTVINSLREILSLPVNSIASGSQPVLGYNYGAGKYARVRKGIRFTAAVGMAYTCAAWLAVVLAPHFLISVFSSDPEVIRAGTKAIRLYFYGFCFMAFQFGGQSAFTALKCPKRAIFFSLLRKAVIVVPLTLLLPPAGFGIDGVFLAESVSNVIGGLACFLTMWFTLYRKLPKEDEL